MKRASEFKEYKKYYQLETMPEDWWGPIVKSSGQGNFRLPVDVKNKKRSDKIEFYGWLALITLIMIGCLLSAIVLIRG